MTQADPNTRLCVANPVGGSGDPTYPLKLAAEGAADCVTWAHGSGGVAVAGRLVDGASGGCLDAGSESTGIYECGSGSGLFQLNQAWAVDSALGGIVNLKEGLCLSAAA